MIKPVTKMLSKSILDSIEIDKIIYAEVTPPRAMGNTGGIMIYIRQSNNTEMLCFETSIYNDKETYHYTEEILYKHFNRENKSNYILTFIIVEWVLLFSSTRKEPYPFKTTVLFTTLRI
jgi:hypothetical protein